MWDSDSLTPTFYLWFFNITLLYRAQFPRYNKPKMVICSGLTIVKTCDWNKLNMKAGNYYL